MRWKLIVLALVASLVFGLLVGIVANLGTS